MEIVYENEELETGDISISDLGGLLMVGETLNGMSRLSPGSHLPSHLTRA